VLIALTSAKGAPGVTTAALALALSWPRRVVLAELDPAGGDVLAGYGRGELSAGGLAELELAARRGGAARHLDGHLLQLDGGGRVRLLPGLADPANARHVNWYRLAAALASTDSGATDVLADCGRLRAEHFPTDIVRRAAVVVLVTGSSLRAVRAATHAIAGLRAEPAGTGPNAGGLAAVIIGPGEPYREREIAEGLGVPVLGSLPRDGKAAAVLSDGAPAGRFFAQSALLRSAREVAARVAEFTADQATRLVPPPDDALVTSDRIGSTHER
jgi:MinD-like ATPase involved in chromosome partitioning or flagellar assembly